MGFLNFNKLFSKNSAPAENPAYEQWQQTAEVPFAGDKEYTELTPEKSDEILQKTIVDGDIFTNARGQDFKLTPEKLKEAGLSPKYEYKLAQMNISLSDIFKVKGRDAVIAYVEDKDGTVKTRSYYRSSSAGLWRYLGDYGRNDGALNIWFGKGFGEDSLNLPFESQKALNSIPKNIDFKPNLPTNVCFFGTAKRYESSRDYDRAKTMTKSKSELPGDYPKEINYKPVIELSMLDEKTPPEQLDLDISAPNFHQEITSFKTNSDLYGDYKVRVFPSEDNKLFYSICETEKDGDRKAWVGNIETNSPIGSTGLHEEWVYVGDLGTPLYEYPEQAGEYGNINDEKNGYVSMWDNYLSKIPLIQNYLESTGNNQ